MCVCELCVWIPCVCMFSATNKRCSVIQVATTLLVAGSTLTFGYLRLHPQAHTQASFKVLGCSCNCRRLAYGSFQLTHMSHDDHAVELIEPWRPRRRQNIITALTTLPQVWVSSCKHQCTTAITTMWRIFVGLSWELHCQWQLDRSLERWQPTGRQKGS